MTVTAGRSLVLVSGYYGFDNLGDEAILEEICNELKELIRPQDIVVLSANPSSTSNRYGVTAVRRTDVRTIASMLLKSRLFISGGGGLFQNTRSLGSIIFYGAQITLAKMLGSKVMIFAQGIGPLRGGKAQMLTRMFFSQADLISVRDETSAGLLSKWQIAATCTADPVWRLTETEPPREVLNALPADKPVYGLSLRTAPDFGPEHVSTLVAKLAALLPSQAHVLLLPLQAEQDLEPLARFENEWAKLGRTSGRLDTNQLTLPSQWISLLRRCNGLVAMRLHALILALKAGIPVAGIAYDPKVAHVLAEFEQPCLILTKDCQPQQWEEALKALVYTPDRLLERSRRRLEVAQNSSCQNFSLLARILACKEVAD